jgi:hypothetical protein
MFRSRAISVIDLPLTKCSRRIRPIVSTISIPHRLLQIEAGNPQAKIQGAILDADPPAQGSKLHAETQPGALALATPDAANLMDAETTKQKMMDSLSVPERKVLAAFNGTAGTKSLPYG